MCIVAEPAGHVRIEPAAPLFQSGGQVPMIERDVCLDVMRTQSIDQPRIEVDAFPVDSAAPFRQYAAPGDAEAIGPETELSHEDHIIGHAVIMVTSDVT